MTNPERIAMLIKKLTHEELTSFASVITTDSNAPQGQQAEFLLAWANQELLHKPGADLIGG